MLIKRIMYTMVSTAGGSYTLYTLNVSCLPTYACHLYN